MAMADPADYGVTHPADAAAVEFRRLRSRIAASSSAMRSWRDDYSRSQDGLTIHIPVYQIENLIGKN